MRLQIRQLMEQADAILLGLAHTDNAAATNRNPGAPDGLNGAQTVFVAPSADDAAVKLGRSVEVMVVSGETRGGQAARLILGQHSQRAADFEVQARRLAAAGLTAYNHNLDTSPEFYGRIISTR